MISYERLSLSKSTELIAIIQCGGGRCKSGRYPFTEDELEFHADTDVEYAAAWLAALVVNGDVVE